MNGETLFAGSSGSGCVLGGKWSHVPGDGGAVWGERGERGEVVAAVSGDGTAAAKPMGGHRRRLLRGERDWLLARIAEKPDLTLRAVLAELAARCRVVSYGALWAFFTSEGITFKKKPARQRTGSHRRGAAAGPVEAASGPA